MPDLSLSLAVSRNPMTEAILAGLVRPQGVDWHVSALHPSEMFWRQLRYREFDISEMSLSSLTIAASRGDRDWTAIPVFTTRKFFHTQILVNGDSGIRQPPDLTGRRVGVPEYQQTAAVWARGALEHEFGVRPQDMRWFMERPPERSHGGHAFRPPPGVQLSYIAPEDNLGEMLTGGDLDAALVYLPDRNLVDRSRLAAGAMSNVRLLFEDPIAEGIRYYRRTGLLPMNHVVVVRTELVERHPWLALNVYSAFGEAKRMATEPLGRTLDPWVQLGLVPATLPDSLRDADPLPYGLAGQLAVVEELGRYLGEQGLVREPVPMTGLFAASSIDI
jgi:4,5-dihydroxyphthalate decarboxylase